MYSKQPLTITEQIALLKERGLRIGPADKAEHILAHISYYRLAEYWQPLQKGDGTQNFKAGSKFSDAIALYNFDRKLRALLFDIIGRIETSLRSKLIYHLSHEHGTWWFENRDLFYNKTHFLHTQDTVRRAVNRTGAGLIKAHQKKYDRDSRLPPATKTLEVVSFSTLSKLYGNLENGKCKSKNIIAEEWGLVNHTFMPSWLQSITHVRNICAHYSRLWNRSLPAKPRLPKQLPYGWIKSLPTQEGKLYLHLCCIKYVLNRVHPENGFAQSLHSLFGEYPRLPKEAMGFEKGWEQEEVWKENEPYVITT